jgi:phenylpyruvate tautomerase PptA (4-oxalocrotonate tautomerase family)
MPHLQFDLNFTPRPEAKRAFASSVIAHFATIMDTGTDHIAISLRCLGEADLTFGRAVEPSRGIAFLNADIRLGRTRDQKRRLSLAIIDELGTRFGVPKESVYVILTEHDGEQFQLSDRVLPSWSTGEDPLADPVPKRRRKARPAARKKASRPGQRGR